LELAALVEVADADDDVVEALSDLLLQPLTDTPNTTVAAAKPATAITWVFITTLLSVVDCSLVQRTSRRVLRGSPRTVADNGITSSTDIEIWWS
jgi:hypothetical protein